jgi:hypothetical protein
MQDGCLWELEDELGPIMIGALVRLAPRGPCTVDLGVTGP